MKQTAENEVEEYFQRALLPKWWNGRHASLRSWCSQGRPGSTPGFGTTFHLLVPHRIRPDLFDNLISGCIAIKREAVYIPWRFPMVKGRYVMMRLVVLLGLVILTSASIAAAAEPLKGNSKKTVPSSVPLSGEEPYAALRRGDFRLAAALFLPLAEKGDDRAQYNLGLLYASGLGVMYDSRAAMKWHRLAAGQGHAGAQNALAQMYAKGNGVSQDTVRAYMWYSLAAESSTAGSKDELMKDRDNLGSHMAPAQIKKAEELTKQCLESNFKKCGEK